MEGVAIGRVDVTVEAARQIMATAVSAGRTHGIGYWADGERVAAHVSGDRLIVFDWVEDFHGRDAGVAGFPGGPGARASAAGGISLAINDIRSAVERILQNPNACAAKGFARQILSEDCDGPLADAIVQVAAFGKVIYG